MNDAIAERLEKLLIHRIVLICAGVGMGRTTLLSRAVMACMSKGMPTRFIDCAGLSSESVALHLRNALQWSRRTKRVHIEGDAQALFALDNVKIEDECEVERLVAGIRRLVAKDVMVMISTLPEGEIMLEQLAEAYCVWSNDLRVMRPENMLDAAVYDEYVQGVPALAQAFRSIDSESLDSVLSDPVYQEAFVLVMDAGICDGMMNEERRFRSALFLLGSGTRDDLQQVIGPLDDTLWRLTARDAPAFGVNPLDDSFNCVGAHDVDCVGIMHATLNTYVHDFPEMVLRIANVLFQKGESSRAAAVCRLCADETKRANMILAWGTYLMEAGEIDAVADALEDARKKRRTQVDGYDESLCMYSALTGEYADEAGAAIALLKGRSPRVLHARLVWWCRGLLKTLQDEPCPEVPAEAEDDPLVRMLLLHGKAFRYIAEGALQEAHNLLTDYTGEAGRPTTTRGLLCFDKALCLLLQGLVPNDQDMRNLHAERAFFERAGLMHVTSLCDAALSAGATMGGRASSELSLEALVHRATSRGDVVLKGMLMLVSATCDMRAQGYAHAHVKLVQAINAFEETGAHSLFAVTNLIHLGLRRHLGERVTKTEVECFKGISKPLDTVIKLLCASMGKKAPAPLGLRGGWSATSQLRAVHWVINILANDCGGVSRNFRNAMPVSWVGEQIRITAGIDEFAGIAFLSSLSSAQPDALAHKIIESESSELVAKRPPRIEIRLLGRFEVYAEGELVPNSRFVRRRAEALLILLAAAPGHVVKRYTAMESIWPTHNYASASKCVYSATSVLRDRLGSVLKDSKDIQLVISNKGQGTLALNTSVITTDIDAFDFKARSLLDENKTSKEAVVLCREIEELYRGDMFVPPTDGMGIVEERARKTRELFADAMIVGSRAALSANMRTLACRFAHKAHDADALREDALYALVTALCAAGRHAEAQHLYERFVGRVVDVARRPPSKQLRENVERQLGEYLKSMPKARHANTNKHQSQQLSLTLLEE